MERARSTLYASEQLDYNEWEGYGTDDCPAPTPYHVSLRDNSSNPSSRVNKMNTLTRFPKAPQHGQFQQTIKRKLLERKREQLRAALKDVELVLATLQ
jgi:hypothetical protein